MGRSRTRELRLEAGPRGEGRGEGRQRMLATTRIAAAAATAHSGLASCWRPGGSEEGPAGQAHGHGPVAAALLRLLHCQRLSQWLAAGRGRGRLWPRPGRRHLWLEGKSAHGRVSPRDLGGSGDGVKQGTRCSQVLAEEPARPTCCPRAALGVGGSRTPGARIARLSQLGRASAGAGRPPGFVFPEERRGRRLGSGPGVRRGGWGSAPRLSFATPPGLSVRS